jgi:hypothetical protein
MIVLGFCCWARSAFPLFYEIDISGDGSFETGQIINVYPQSTATIDLYIDGYSCPPDDELYALDAYFLYDSSIVHVNHCFPFDWDHGGPFDPSLCGCTSPAPNIYRPLAGSFILIPVTGGRQKFATLEIEFIQDDAYADLVLAADLTPYGYPGCSESIVVDCNNVVHENTTADAIVTMIRSTTPLCYCDFNEDDRVGLADLVIMKDEFLRSDCGVNPCQADCNGDGSVNLTDLTMLKIEFNRRDCPEMP